MRRLPGTELGIDGIRKGRLVALALVVALLAPGVAGGQQVDTTAASPRRGAESPTQVTLLTGDRVSLMTVDGQVVTRIQPAQGRETIRFITQRVGDQVSVVPSDAVGLLAEGRLDPRLFDVTTLVEFGYDDASRPDLPLIVESVGRQAPLPEAEVTTAGADTVPLPAAGASAVRQPKDRAAELWSELTTTGGEISTRSLERPVGKVWLDGLLKPVLDWSVPQVGAPAAWEAGYTGAGVRVAVLDGGIDVTHPDLAGRVAESRDFTGEANPDDGDGHGTHVASTLGGTGAASGGRYRGVAPDAALLNGKVCNLDGCSESSILQAMQWAADRGARVVNMSLSVPGRDLPEIDPLEVAINRLSAERGTLFVVAVGNDGPQAETVGSPASADAALAVGAVDDADQLADFSGRGPRMGDAALKPEITAPGVGLVGARARNWSGDDPIGERYASESGTSGAAPHVTGAAALIAQQHPGWTGAQIKALLVGSADDTEGVDAFAQGAGRLDLRQAVDQSFVAEPAVVSAGRPAWPHDDDEPIHRTITYRNLGPEPVTLDLAVDGMGPGGGPAPAHMFRLSDDQVAVPAGGGASVEVTVDTSVPGPDGHYSAWVVASATTGGAVVSTPVAVDKEVESYDLTIVPRNHDGEAATSHSTRVFGLDQFMDYSFLYDRDGSIDVRLPRGRYLVESVVPSPDDQIAQLVQPLVDLQADTTVELDARLARPVEVSFERHDPLLEDAAIGYERLGGPEPYATAIDSIDGVTTAHFGPEVPDDEMTALMHGVWSVPDDTGGVERSELSYELAWFEHGRMFTGLTRHVRARDLARIDSSYRATGERRRYQHVAFPRAPGHPLLALPGERESSVEGIDRALPARHKRLRNTEGVEWRAAFRQLVGPDVPPEATLESDYVRYRSGRTSGEQWNAAVLGPLVSSSLLLCGDAVPASQRVGDTVRVRIPMHSDAAGHPGCAAAAEARTRLSRNGELIGEADVDGFRDFDVPAEAGTYRLEVNVTREESAALSSRVTATWTFRSQHVAGNEPEALPLLAVRFAPRLDDHNRVPAGDRVTVPFTVDRLGDVGTVRTPRVEASFDEGATWTPVRVSRGRHDRYRAILDHPDQAGYVSLRASATDDRGNRVEQTIIRAYELTAG